MPVSFKGLHLPDGTYDLLDAIYTGPDIAFLAQAPDGSLFGLIGHVDGSAIHHHARRRAGACVVGPVARGAAAVATVATSVVRRGSEREPGANPDVTRG